MEVSFMSNAKQIDQLLEGFLKRGLPGCGLKVVQYGNTLYEGYFGVTDIDTKTPVTKDTLFRQASMSKIPLYTVMMMLYERGKFLLTDQLEIIFRNGRQVPATTGIRTAMSISFQPAVQSISVMSCP